MSEREINERAEQTASSTSNLAESAITNSDSQNSYFAARPNGTGPGAGTLPDVELKDSGAGSDSPTQTPSPTAPGGADCGRTIRNSQDGEYGERYELNRQNTAPISNDHPSVPPVTGRVPNEVEDRGTRPWGMRLLP